MLCNFANKPLAYIIIVLLHAAFWSATADADQTSAAVVTSTPIPLNRIQRTTESAAATGKLADRRM